MEANLTKGKIDNSLTMRLYEGMLYPRLIEEKMLNLLRQGKISKWFSGIGQEAISVGCTMALEAEDTIFPMHRNLGVFTSREIPLSRLLSQWQGKANGFTKGRDRSFHFGAVDYNVIGMISHLGAQLSLADGVALAHKLSKSGNIALAMTGEGGTSEGEFHEALNVAAVWQLPVIFVIENNGYGLSTPTSEQYRCEHLVDRAKGYGMKGIRIDGNNVEEVYSTIAAIRSQITKSPEPWLVECDTFRMRGHEEASGVKYVPKKLMEQWAKKDPIDRIEKTLLSKKITTKKKIAALRAGLKKSINATAKESFKESAIASSVPAELSDVYTPSEEWTGHIDTSTTTEMRYIDSISDGLNLAMQKYDNLVLMGQDIADYGGVFKITDGFTERYGKGRVRNTPICESAILGAVMGLSLEGVPSMVEMQFSDFVTCGFNQIVNNIAKVRYRWGLSVNTVIRMPSGGSVGAGPFHSQSTEAWFTHVPGLKIVYPSNPIDAKGLLLAAFSDPNPVLYFEHKGLYRSSTADVPTAYYETPIGKAALISEGSDCTIVTYGLGVKWAKEVTSDLNLAADIIDLRTLSPIDYDTISSSVKKTNKVLILHEDVEQGGIGGDISSYISEHLFEHLDGPVIRVSSLNSPVPFASELEEKYLANHRLKDKLTTLLSY
jgi:2-oxoisovalerate dehydrogenase E1 component